MRRAPRLSLVFVAAIAACMPRGHSRRSASGGAVASGGADDGAPQTPAELDARYREVSRHLMRNPVWDSPLRSLSEDALATLNRYSQSRGNPETYVSLEVTSNDWAIARHPATGAVTGRAVGAITVARFPDGHCMVYGASFRQEFVDGEFSSTLTTSGTGGGAGVRCETVEAIAEARPDVAR